jgi:hypothetical protein
MQYSSYITSMEHKDSYTINVLYMFTLHIPATCVTIMTDIDCFSDVIMITQMTGICKVTTRMPYNAP